MREQTRKVVNVLGIDVSVMKPEKAVNITMNYINRKELSSVFFHTASSSLYCQNKEGAAKWMMESCDLVLAGDRSMEQTIKHEVYDEENSERKSLFADMYVKRLLARLHKESREIYAIMSQEEHFTALKEYIQSTYPQISVEGAVFDEKQADDAERIVNEINGSIPDIVFICLPVEHKMTFAMQCQNMMNTHLVIFIDSLNPLVLTETKSVPQWIQSMHLTSLYQWIKREGKIQEQIIHSIFRRSVLDEEVEKEESDSPNEIDHIEVDLNQEMKQDGEE